MTNLKTILRATAFGVSIWATAAHAGAIISAAGIQDANSGNVDHVSQVAGEGVTVATSDVDARATTSYGINRIYNQAAAGMDGESYASSVWSENFVAQGTGMVHVAFTFTLDGSVNYGALGSDRDFNYILTAMSGNWGLSGANGYDDITASQPFASTEMAGGIMQTFTGQTVFPLDEIGSALATTATGSGGTTMERTLTRDGNVFFLDTTTTDPSAQVNLGLYPDHFTNNTIAGGAPLPYSVVPPFQDAYNSLLANYPVLGQAALCDTAAGAADSGCLSGTLPPTPLSLEFDIAAGSSFTLFSALNSERAEDGTVDFFHTVRLSDIAVTGGTLASSNSLFTAGSDGHYAFADATTAAVPEPSTWAMLIVGFALIGATMRGRSVKARTALA